MPRHKRFSKAEGKDIRRKLAVATFAVLKLTDGATPQELADATEAIVDLGDTYHRAVKTLEDVSEDES